MKLKISYQLKILLAASSILLFSFNLSAENNDLFLDKLIKLSPECTDFTEEELDYIKEHNKIRVVSDPNWAPFEYYTTADSFSSYTGINFSLLKKLSEKTGFTIDFIPTKNYKESTELFITEQADIITGINNSLPDYMKASVHHTIPLYSIPLVLIGRNSQLPEENSTIAIPQNFSYQSSELYSALSQKNIKFVFLKTSRDVFNAFYSGKYNYIFVNKSEASMYKLPDNYHIFDSDSDGNSDRIPSINYDFTLALNKTLDLTALNILNKAIKNISSEEFNVIVYASMIEKRYMDKQLDNEEVHKKVLGIVITVFILLIIVLTVFLILLFRRKNNQTKEYDELTGLPSFTKFKHDVRKLLNKALPNEYYILSLDINNFSFINDSYGFNIGNALLLEVSQQFMIETKEIDGLICRFYADNFIIFAKNPGFIGLIEEFVYAITSNTEYIKNLLPEQYDLTFSSGVYYIVDPSLDLSVMIDNANEARKFGKEKSATHRITEFTQAMNSANELKKSITLTMNKAIENREFEVFYQPKFLFSTSEIIGAEALIRWNNPEQGFLPPDKFIPLFEHNGFIQKIDLFVFEEVCKFLDNWNHSSKNTDCPHPLVISFNLSRFHLYNPNLIKELKEISNKYQIHPCQIEVELTESIMFDNKKRLIKAMKEIKNAGFSISIDDFGSGYSSLNLLKDMPADVLKLDKEFLSGTKDNEKENIIINSVVEMAKKLQITTVAEGVETQKQSDLLKSIGCDIVQGYFYSKPIQKNDFINLLGEKYL